MYFFNNLCCVFVAIIVFVRLLKIFSFNNLNCMFLAIILFPRLLKVVFFFY